VTDEREPFAPGIREMIETVLMDLHTSMPGRVVSFNRLTQTAEIQPVLKRKYRDNDPENLPVITDVPVVFPGSGGLWLIGDVEVDSYVLLHFQERSIATWQASGGIIDPEKARRHNISDAVATVGLWPDPGVLLSPVTADTLSIRNSQDTIKIEVNKDGTITVANVLGSMTLSTAGQLDVNGNLTVDP
jgi:hypothetical protein